MKHIPRFHVKGELSKGREIGLSRIQLHHALAVLRLSDNDELRVFNDKFGEWRAHINNRKKGTVVCDNLIISPRNEDGPTLVCSLIHPNKFAIILEKATELGVQKIVPVISQYSQYRTINKDRCVQIILSACEQCCRLSVPYLTDVVSLSDFLDNFPSGYTLLVGDTQGSPNKLKNAISKESIFLVGPEGGFSDDERQLLHRCEFVKTFHFGTNVLRSETAAIAFLGCWIDYNT